MSCPCYRLLIKLSVILVDVFVSVFGFRHITFNIDLEPVLTNYEMVYWIMD